MRRQYWTLVWLCVVLSLGNGALSLVGSHPAVDGNVAVVVTMVVSLGPLLFGLFGEFVFLVVEPLLRR